jgi:hypothetical protein
MTESGTEEFYQSASIDLPRFYAELTVVAEGFTGGVELVQLAEQAHGAGRQIFEPELGEHAC